MSLWRRLWVYQAERFPLVAHGLLVAALVAGSVGFVATQAPWPSPPIWGVAFVVTFGFFLQLRILDEYKDAADDAAHRPYRPVPRGLVTLAELRIVGIVVAIVQLGLTVLLVRSGIVPLLLVWGAMGLLGREFFVEQWLRARPAFYMLSHMIILPLILLSTVMMSRSGESMSLLPVGIGWFLAAGYANGVVFEIGRKLRAPEDEEVGVDTYSAVWGINRAVIVWWGALLTAGLCAVMAAHSTGQDSWFALVLGVGASGAGWVAWQMVRQCSSKAAGRIELATAFWVLLVYLCFTILGGLA